MESTPFLTPASHEDRSFPEDDPGTSSNPNRADDGRLMYFENQVQFAPDHAGGDDIEAIREELRLGLIRTGITSPYDMPLPPAGLPGKLNEQYSIDEEAWTLLQLGASYVEAIVFNERRSMHNRWQEARHLISKIERRAVEAYTASEIRQTCEAAQAFTDSQRVYFIASETGPIKIGIAVNPQSRLKGLQTSHHERLTLLATCEGGLEQERAYHALYAAHRLHGEWFARAPEILAEIERIGANQSIRVVERDL